MTQREKDEIDRLPPKYRPMGAWGYFGYSILFAIPLIGWIFLFICALDGSKIVRRSFARSYFCILILVGFILLIVFALGMGGALLDMIAGSL